LAPVDPGSTGHQGRPISYAWQTFSSGEFSCENGWHCSKFKIQVKLFNTHDVKSTEKAHGTSQKAVAKTFTIIRKDLIVSFFIASCIPVRVPYGVTTSDR
jgi:hypothetical protein